ncbi:hypothetical protein [Curtobacterium sp. MCSS17_007]|uniref:hypothetical protein n=1 Tax=Curtobacterium sp. MCSS17_007 TaxID=2175646 RepID=UPI000DA7EBBD|nr:hypothetical protein [Curtobacterium sp. MCSS17_007]WIE74479.1 hypothetical protein DEJ22_009305 [Curtobacterium sp. MCSS17_007]
MDLGQQRVYEFELWTKDGQRIADISALAFNRQFTLTRNEAEQLTFSLDLFAFESYCANALGGADPKVLIAPYVTDVKVKRNGVYLFGTQVVDVSFNLQQDNSRAGSIGGTGQNYIVTITATGYLNLLKDRYVTKTYTQTERTAIAADLIATTQAQPNGSVGMTIASNQYGTGKLSDRTYQSDEVKSKIQELAQLSDSPFDFGFDYMKNFRTYSQIGARRLDVNLIYGGALGNVAGFAMSRSALTLFNKIYGVGSGFGSDQLSSTKGDVISQVNYYVREKVVQFNSVVLQDTLDVNTQTEVDQAKDILELPVVTITGKEIPANAFLVPGDRVPLRVMDHKWLDNVNGLYRIEQVDVTIDENDFESAVQLTFDSFGVSQGE